MSDKKEFCCEEMYSHLFRSDKKTSEIHFDYYPVFREYFIDYKKEYGEDIQLVRYCPWCGSKLPKRLRHEWFDTLEKEYKIETDIGEYKERTDIPQEFKSDEWWKKRGL
jgi:hypothetical protein